MHLKAHTESPKLQQTISGMDWFSSNGAKRTASLCEIVANALRAPGASLQLDWIAESVLAIQYLIVETESNMSKLAHDVGCGSQPNHH